MISPEIISRIIKLVDRNNERVVLVDPTSGKGVVVMDLDAYERLSAVTATPTAAVDGFIKPQIEESKIEQKQVETSDKPTESSATVIQSQSFTATAKSEETVVNPFPVINKERGPHRKNAKNDPLAAPAFADLTQSELLDKINRDIASWKTAQDRRRTDELRSAAVVSASSGDTFEDEERFYLEPIE